MKVYIAQNMFVEFAQNLIKRGRSIFFNYKGLLIFKQTFIKISFNKIIQFLINIFKNYNHLENIGKLNYNFCLVFRLVFIRNKKYKMLHLGLILFL